MTEDQVYQLLLEQIKRAGGQRAFAQALGVTPSYINDVVNKRRLMSDRILAAIGIERQVTYTFHEKNISETNVAASVAQPKNDDPSTAS